MQQLNFKYLITASALSFCLFFSSLVSAQKKKVSCVGNSITYGYEFSDPYNQSYPGQLRALLGSNWEVGNFGDSGRSMLKGSGYSYWDSQLYKDALASKPDYLILKLGTNDSKRWLWNWLGTNFKKDYKAMLQSFQALSTKPEILMCLLVPSENAEWQIFKSDIKDKVNPQIKEIALEMGLSLIDLYTEMDKNKPEWYLADGVHPSVAGAGIIAQKVKEMLLMPKPEVTFANGVVTAPDGDDYQWYLNGAAVSVGKGGKLKEMTVTESGMYKVSVKLNANNETRIVSKELKVSLQPVKVLPTAKQLASKMKIGWNLGNTLEATWAAPGTTTQVAIDSVKAAGFNTVRLPVAWFHHSDTTTSKIDVNWLANVKRVVDYCIRDSMYVILNAHWDHGWLENRVNAANKDKVNERQQAYWTQIANHFRDYDEHLLFAGANEPNVEDAAGMSVLLSYHQTFINTVRATGGNNITRTLIIQGPSTDIGKTNQLMNTMPADQAADRLMVEVHYYLPWNFCGLESDTSWGKMFYYWGKGNHSATDVTRNATFDEESDMDKHLASMKSKFIDKGIPVIIGEYGAFRKDLRSVSPPSDQALHNASIEYYYRYFMKSATTMGFITYCWDTGGIFNFTTGKINDRVVLNAIMQGVKDAATDTAVLNNKEIGIYPNPFTSAFSIKGNNLDEITRISVFDMQGRLVATVGQSDIKKGMTLGAALAPNIYTVQIYGIGFTKSFKVIKK